MNDILLVILLYVFVLIPQSVWLFLDARKQGHNYWVWGILGLIQAPMPILLYLLFIRKLWKKLFFFKD